MSLTELGFYRPTYEEILNEKIELAKNLFGEDIETDEKTPFGKFIRIGANDLSKAYEDLENVYYARFPNTASGISLDRLCAFVGIARNPATYAEYMVTIAGTVGTYVDDITVCGEDTEIVFHNIEPFIVGEDGTVSFIVECETLGTAGNTVTINDIVNPIAEVDGVVSCVQTKIADDIESDYDLRRRFAKAIESVGGSSLSDIRTAILQVTGVKDAVILENTSAIESVEGIQPHSFMAIVYGGEDRAEEIAQAIFNTKSAGIATSGKELYPVLDESGIEHDIRFSFAAYQTVLIKVVIRTDKDFPTNGIQQVQDNIADFINNLALGETLVLSRLYGYTYSVGGISEVVTLEGSIDNGATYTENNITAPTYNVLICGGVTVEVV